jgi:inner membrane protein
LAATLALIGVVEMWGVRDYEHRIAVNALQARTYNDDDPIRVSAYPNPIDPFHWFGVVEAPAFFALAPVSSVGPEVDPDGRLEFRYKPAETPVTLAAKKSYVGRVFLDWAKYPIAETEVLQGSEEGYIVRFQDLRFEQLPNVMTGVRPRRVLGFAVKLDKDLHVVGDVFETRDENGAITRRVVLPEPR